MDYRWEKPLREDRHRHQRDNPSFSSSLLDAIYRSIDESNDREEEEEEEVIFYTETMRKKQNINEFKSEGGVRKEEELTSFHRACMVEKWMEMKKDSHEKAPVRRKSTADSLEKPPRRYLDRPVSLNSSSSSSESSSGGRFSSSESEQFHGHSSRTTSSTHKVHRPRPIRTSISNGACPDKAQAQMYLYNQQERKLGPPQKPKHEGGFGKTKSKALKIYGDLKKVKQPISPGGRLASFLNSLFTAGNAKKAKMSYPSSGYVHDHRKVKSEQESACSSASSFSRSCMSKTPSSRGKLSNNSDGAKRSVRFYPVSVILDEDSKPCGHKNLYGSEESLMTIATKRSSPTNEELKIHLMSENRRMEEFARDLLKTYHINKKLDEDVVFGSEDEEEEEEDDDDDDGASYASSDLFELDNLSSIGIDQRYREELPVYETTHLSTNRAIANGLLV